MWKTILDRAVTSDSILRHMLFRAGFLLVPAVGLVGFMDGLAVDDGSAVLFVSDLSSDLIGDMSIGSDDRSDALDCEVLLSASS